jgi:putative Mg2+ transporter-C (MgtC) family protein
VAGFPDVHHLLSWSEELLRLGSAALMGAVIGLNRELRGKEAGLRTQALVALGAAASVVTIYELAGVTPSFDTSAISRVLQGILTGIGFLGGGVILRDSGDKRIHGLTTAASVWLSAALGMACGTGLWRLALLALVLALLVLHFGFSVEAAVHRRFPPKNLPPP